MISLAFDHINFKRADVLPWWCLLHYLVCAATVLMFEILRNDNIDLCKQLVEEAWRPLEWLCGVGSVDIAAKRVEIQLGWLLAHVKVKLEQKASLQAAYSGGRQN